MPMKVFKTDFLKLVISKPGNPQIAPGGTSEFKASLSRHYAPVTYYLLCKPGEVCVAL